MRSTHPQGGEQEEQDTRDKRDRRDQPAACSPPRPATSTAPPATAARDELGPVEICREVQKSA